MKDPKAMYALSYGLFVLTARRGEQDNGCIINTGIQVTSQPNRVLIAVNKSNFTHDMILETGAFNLSVLTEKADFSLFQRFGFQSGRDVDKFQGFAHTLRTDNGLLAVTEGTSAWLSCKVASTVDLGTHTLFVADVTDGDTLSREPSATYAYYQANIKPRPAAPAAETCAEKAAEPNAAFRRLAVTAHPGKVRRARDGGSAFDTHPLSHVP